MRSPWFKTHSMSEMFERGSQLAELHETDAGHEVHPAVIGHVCKQRQGILAHSWPISRIECVGEPGVVLGSVYHQV